MKLQTLITVLLHIIICQANRLRPSFHSDKTKQKYKTDITTKTDRKGLTDRHTDRHTDMQASYKQYQPNQNLLNHPEFLFSTKSKIFM